MNEEGGLAEVSVYGQKYKGKALYDVLERYVRKACFSMENKEMERGKDMLWFCGVLQDHRFMEEVRWQRLNDI